MAPTIAGTNVITQAEDALVNAIAELVSFQQFTDTITVDAAKARIHMHVGPDKRVQGQDTHDDAEFDALFPLLMIGPTEAGSTFFFGHSADGYARSHDCNFNLQLRFERLPNLQLTGEDSLRELRNQVGTVLVDLINATEWATTRLGDIGMESPKFYPDGVQMVEGWIHEITNIVGGE